MNGPHGQPEGADDQIDQIMRSEVETKRVIADINRDRENRRKRGQLPLLLVLAPIATALTVWNFARTHEPASVFSADRSRAGAEYTIFLTATAIEQFADSMGFLPIELEQIGMDEDDLEYHAVGESYSLSINLEDGTLMYSSGDDLSSYENAFDRATEGVPK